MTSKGLQQGEGGSHQPDIGFGSQGAAFGGSSQLLGG